MTVPPADRSKTHNPGLEEFIDSRWLPGAGGNLSEETVQRLRSFLGDEADSPTCRRFLTVFLPWLTKTSDPDHCLIQFERVFSNDPERTRTLEFLAEHPRAAEILVRIFSSSSYLSQILFRHPSAIFDLIVRESLLELRSREQYRNEALEVSQTASSELERLNALRRYQQGEYLRLGTCDAFGLMDLKSVTVQLSLLADGLVQCCLQESCRRLGLSEQGFVVIACGKLGGEELNYSSDIDLLFLSEGDPVLYWPVGQKIIQSLGNVTEEGFLYRVDMRLRPWGESGPLVNSIDSHLDYLRAHGQPWERQALIKARVVAGDRKAGARFLKQVDRLIYTPPPPDLRAGILESKQRIERGLSRRGDAWGEVKSGQGSLRDVEFVTQYLQLKHGYERPELRTFNTLDGLVRLVEFGFLRPDEYRQLSTGYLYLRKVEHVLQLMHNVQSHKLPEDAAALESLAYRLDFDSAEQFVHQYEMHRQSIRAIFQHHLGSESEETAESSAKHQAADRLLERIVLDEPGYDRVFSERERERHRQLLGSLGPDRLAAISASPQGDSRRWQVAVAGHDEPGALLAICGLLFANDLDIVEGRVYTEDDVRSATSRNRIDDATLFLNYFTLEVAAESEPIDAEFWNSYEVQLGDLMREMRTGDSRKAQARVARLAARRVGHERRQAEISLKPISISIDNESRSEMTVLHVQSEDTPGFLYELSNALMLSGVNIRRMEIGTTERFARDTLSVTDLAGNKILDETRLKELTTTILLVKHCMHLLPTAPDPESAWLHLREFLERMLSTPGWCESIGDLNEPRFLQSMTQILGVSDYLWEDFLRLHHDRVLPFVQNDAYLSEAKSVETLERELQQLLAQVDDFEQKKQFLNRFKDRETFRTDVRHLLGYLSDFARFSLELSNICDVVIEAGLLIARDHLEQSFGYPIDQDSGHPCRFCAMALGKCGGRELGFASDIELLFLYEGRGMTNGPNPIREQFFYERQIALLGELIVARREGIFELDLRLRPYGTAGPLPVSVESFRKYYEPDGPAWPYERQALVKLRPLAGDSSLATKALALRDEILYCGRPFDVASMHGMREKQMVQHVEGGTIHAKLSPGGLVEIEYLVQGLQIAWGREFASLRVPNTLTAIDKLKAAEVLSEEHAERLIQAYRLLRELIDALRMVRGNARDLTLPPVDSEEFEFLARRTGFGENPEELLVQFERNSSQVLDVLRKLEGRSAFQRSV